MLHWYKGLLFITAIIISVEISQFINFAIETITLKGSSGRVLGAWHVGGV